MPPATGRTLVGAGGTSGAAGGGATARPGRTTGATEVSPLRGGGGATTSRSWTSLAGTAGLWEAVTLGVSTEMPAKQTPIATAVVAIPSDQCTSRRFMPPHRVI